jgi:magnesium transporter
VLRTFPLGGDGDHDGRGVWLDLLEPTEAERGEAERLTGLALPTREHLSEIEFSSRLRQRDGVLTMSTPMVALVGARPRGLAPIGFVLSQETLVTLRFSELSSFDEVAALFEHNPGSQQDRPGCALATFVDLCEQMVDRMADSLEALAAALTELSGAVFAVDEPHPKSSVRTNSDLRDRVRLVGQFGDRASNTRDALLGLGRILAYVDGIAAQDWQEGRFAPRLASLRQDVSSLNDYEAHLSDKVQFLLDALVGMIGIAQNDIFKILTIFSIVGIPPTLVASIYGMNFKGMPELTWTYGYPYGLAVIALSAIIPVVWFKRRGWF